MIALQPIREAFERSELSVRAVARMTGRDWSHLHRLLKDKPTYAYRTLASGERKRYAIHAHTCSEGFARDMARVLGLDPVDLGF